MKIARLMDPNTQTLLTKLLTAQVPMKTAFKLKRISKVLDEAMSDYNETRLATLKKFADLDEAGEIKGDENGQALFSVPEKRAEFEKELNELLNEEVAVLKVGASELGDKLNLSVADLMGLEDVIAEDL